MIRCNKCGIDRDRCSCNNRVRNFIAYPIIAFSLILMATGAISCNTEKQAARIEERKSNKALKLIQKSERVQPNELAKWCAKRYNPIDSINESTDTSDGGVIAGEIQYVYVDCDSLIKANNATKRIDSSRSPSKANYYKIPCPPCDSVKIMNIFKSRFERAANTAALDSMARFYDRETARRDKTIKDQGEVIAGQKVTINILYWIAGLLGAYTLLRWILRIWNIKLP